EPTSVDFDRVENKHHDFLGSFLGCKEKAKKAIIYSHTKTINAFSALLDPKEAEEISKHEDVISIFESKPSKLYTTNSWNYLGMEEPAGAINHASNPNSLWEKAKYGENIIIANFDTGVWPGSAMFNDQGMGPVPAKWKGRCGDENDGSSCNKKLLSVRKFCQSVIRKYGDALKGTDTFKAIDNKGHGTHTLSTAAGRFTSGINTFGFHNATARGGMPNAR
ncbi:S8 family serine peptidase, partial [Ralstonia pseudosolanacearum]|uniref:S8 family serine peptidase n=1 Tax=Ralstonia pseudosolanacearum TaxID=1310165 RepID=UPI003CF3A7EE